ncbi:hypothetical protein KVR01_006131 [Diaporthe batatas]|uniref:uncharacterized protein n=1 Tax=Diaporthe batatas TaxID=748121 RepID=UPI001D037021|nr:uncharacterized protein KVR01_006131 [Diaporthe batatas]KAG8164213.1 hypothetical protein KVR01_006131 [Diaporthe batatas]
MQAGESMREKREKKDLLYGIACHGARICRPLRGKTIAHTATSRNQIKGSLGWAWLGLKSLAARLHDLDAVHGVVSCGRPGILGDNRQGQVIGVMIHWWV